MAMLSLKQNWNTKIRNEITWISFNWNCWNPWKSRSTIHYKLSLLHVFSSDLCLAVVHRALHLQRLNFPNFQHSQCFPQLFQRVCLVLSLKFDRFVDYRLRRLQVACHTVPVWTAESRLFCPRTSQSSQSVFTGSHLAVRTKPIRGCWSSAVWRRPHPESQWQ